LRDIDYLVMARALGARAGSRGELLSFLLFDGEFVEELIRMGMRDASRWLRRHPKFWCRDADHDLALGDFDNGQIREQEALEEFRAARRF
jgi:NTE family protein